jgi:hypothetical protein
MTAFWDNAPCSLVVLSIMKAVGTSETSVCLYETALCNVPEDSHFQTRRSEYLKSHKIKYQQEDV